MTNKKPLISVLVCNFNYSRYIGEALDSIKNQDYPNLEVVIVDDASTDDSIAVINDYIEKNKEMSIRLEVKIKNQGICYARNDAIDMASGDYFIFLDSDDTIPGDYISKMYETLWRQRADVVYGDVKAFGSEIYTTDYPLFSQRELLRRNFINVTSLVKREAVDGHRFDVALNRKTHEDYDFWLGLSLSGLTFVKSNDTYLNYRIQASSRNENHLGMKERVQRATEAWKYSYVKYRKQFPEQLNEEVIFDFYDCQLEVIGDELSKLNDTVHKELIPELHRREVHIEYLASKTMKSRFDRARRRARGLLARIGVGSGI